MEPASDEIDREGFWDFKTHRHATDAGCRVRAAAARATLAALRPVQRRVRPQRSVVFDARERELRPERHDVHCEL